MEAYAFYPIALLTVVAALVVISRKNPVHSVLALVFCFIGVAAIYIVLEAEFLAAVQILVYAGGILVLYLFVVMLVSVREGESRKTARHRLPALVLGTLLFVELAIVFVRASPAAGPTGQLLAAEGNTRALGKVLLVHYLVPFEIASLLLLVAMIGAIVLAKKRI